MKAYRGSRGTAPLIPDPDTRDINEWSNSRPVRFIPSSGGRRDGLNVSGEEKNLLPLMGFELRSIVAIPTGLTPAHIRVCKSGNL